MVQCILLKCSKHRSDQGSTGRLAPDGPSEEEEEDNTEEKETRVEQEGSCYMPWIKKNGSGREKQTPE